MIRKAMAHVKSRHLEDHVWAIALTEWTVLTSLTFNFLVYEVDIVTYIIGFMGNCVGKPMWVCFFKVYSVDHSISPFLLLEQKYLRLDNFANKKSFFSTQFWKFMSIAWLWWRPLGRWCTLVRAHRGARDHIARWEARERFTTLVPLLNN
jgi:hypothetical protein